MSLTFGPRFQGQGAKINYNMQPTNQSASNKFSVTVDISSISQAVVAQTYFENTLTADFILHLPAIGSNERCSLWRKIVAPWPISWSCFMAQTPTVFA